MTDKQLPDMFEKKIDLIIYELPSYSELTSIDWIQEIIAKRCLKKINKKMARYQLRVKRAEFFKKLLTNKKYEIPTKQQK